VPQGGIGVYRGFKSGQEAAWDKFLKSRKDIGPKRSHIVEVLSFNFEKGLPSLEVCIDWKRKRGRTFRPNGPPDCPLDTWAFLSKPIYFPEPFFDKVLHHLYPELTAFVLK